MNQEMLESFTEGRTIVKLNNMDDSHRLLDVLDWLKANKEPDDDTIIFVKNQDDRFLAFSDSKLAMTFKLTFG